MNSPFPVAGSFQTIKYGKPDSVSIACVTDGCDLAHWRKKRIQSYNLLVLLIYATGGRDATFRIERSASILSLAFHANQRYQARHSPRQSRQLGGLCHSIYVLVRAGCLLTFSLENSTGRSEICVASSGKDCQREKRPMYSPWAKMWPRMARSTSFFVAPGIRSSLVSRA